MRHTGTLVLLLLLSSALLAQSDASKQPQSASGGAESTAAGQQPPASPEQPSNSGNSSHLVIKKYVKAQYPREAQNQEMQGRVWVYLIIDEAGDVVSIEPVSGEGPLLASAMAAMKQWKFEPYIQNGRAVRVSTKMYYDFAFTEKIRDDAQPVDTGHAGKDATPISHATTGAGDSDSRNPQRVRIAQGVSQGLLIHQVVPICPGDARRKHIQGTVVLKAIIGKDGLIKDLQVVSSPSRDLSQAAKEAVEQWRYRPYSLAGEIVEVDTTINVNFQLR